MRWPWQRAKLREPRSDAPSAELKRIAEVRDREVKRLRAQATFITELDDVLKGRPT